MQRRRQCKCILLLTAFLWVGTALLAQPQQSGEPFIIEANRPFVYLKFDHYGPGVRFREEEPRLRLWFKFVNNSNVPILLRTFGVPEGTLPHEVGVMDRVVADEVSGDGAVNLLRPPPEPAFPPGLTDSPPKSAVEAKPEKMPPGYLFEVGSLMRIDPGMAALFSIPANQLGNSWHIEIPFRFDVTRSRGPWEPEIGGEPETFLLYSFADLPVGVRDAIRK